VGYNRGGVHQGAHSAEYTGGHSGRVPEGGEEGGAARGRVGGKLGAGRSVSGEGQECGQGSLCALQGLVKDGSVCDWCADRQDLCVCVYRRAVYCTVQHSSDTAVLSQCSA